MSYSTNDFPLNPPDGTLAELEREDGTSVIYKWDESESVWKIVGKNGGTQQYITTSDVNTTQDPPTTPAGWTGFNVQEDLSYLTDQKLVNWFLAEQIITNKEEAEQISEDLTALTSRVATGEGIQEQIQETIDTALTTQSEIQNTISDALTEQQNIQTEQGVQNNQINALETQLQLLAQATGGVWKYQRNITGGSVRPPNGARFYGTHVDNVETVLTDWSDIRLLMVNKKDTNGTDFIFTGFEVGDKIEIIATDASSLCIGTIETAATQESYGNMVIKPDRTKGGPEEDKEYLISVYRPGEEGSNLDTDVLDGRYVVKTGDTITGNLYLDTGSGLYTKEIIKSTRDTGYALQVKPGDTGDATAYIHTNGNAEFAHVKVRDTPTNNSDLTTKEYVDGQINAIPEVDLSGYLPLAGGTVTGNLTVQGVSQFATAKSSNTPTNSSDLTTKAYVDQAVAAANVLGPARLAWKYNSNTSSDADPGNGNFRIQLTGGATYYRFSFKTTNGVDFGHLAPGDSGAKTTEYGPYGTIWLYYPDTNQWRLKQEFRVSAWRWNYNNHIEFKRSSKFGVSDIDFTSGNTYYITVGGFF